MEKDIFVHGLVVTSGNGVINLQGVLSSFIGEIFSISVGLGLCLGFTVNLFRDKLWNLHIGGLLLTPGFRISEGSKVTGLATLVAIFLGDFILGGSIVDGLGNVILNTGRVDVRFLWMVESPALSIIDRQSVHEPLQTGIITVDSIVPIGRGQRELVLGDRQTGKTSISIDCIINQKYEKVCCLYLPIGQKSSSILDIFMSLVLVDSLFNVTMLVSSASQATVLQYLSAYSGASISEFLMYIGQNSVFMALDDLSKHAGAYRELSLLLRRPPGREAYPGEVFFLHSRLLERSSKLSHSLGSGSMSCFPIIETLAGDIGAYIATNVISITDGQLSLSQDLFNSGILPAIDVGLSVTRVGSAAQWDGMKLFGSTFKLELAQYVELKAFSQFSSDLPEDTKNRLDRSTRVVELLKQVNGSTMTLYHQVGLLSSSSSSILRNIIAVHRIPQYVGLYVSLPSWILLIVSPTLLSLSIIRFLTA
jgi:F-type H+-transporting ATPase subunit alpha